MKKSIFLYLLLIPLFTIAQPAIKGRVVNASSGEPLAGSSVFISGTSIGTSSDKTGYFELISIPSGRHDLIISSIGYETNVFAFNSGQLPLNLKIEMLLKVKELENVIVEPFTEEGWDKWGDLFTKNFIGSTPNASSCRIRNKESVRFRYYKKSNRLVAFSDEPLIIENRALGYKISYQLEQFEVDFKASTSVFAGYPFFEELYKNARGTKRRWDKARDKAYYGSMQHFMRCLYADSLSQYGYEVRRMKRSPNLEKERVKKLYGAAMTRNTPSATVITIGTYNDTLQKDSLDYYSRIMRQKDYIETYGKDLLTADSLVIHTDGEYREFYFNDYLYIVFKNETEEKAYIEFSLEHRNPTFQRSYLTLVQKNPISLDKNGNYFPPQELYSMAYWGWSEKTADLLPSEYEPLDKQ